MALQAYFDRRAQAGKVVVRGRTRIERLVVIGTSCPPLAVEALRTAVREAKQGKDVDLYLDTCQALFSISPDDPLAKADMTWADTRTKQIKAEGDRLEAELKGYKNNLIKESIRMGSEDLGNFAYSTGDFPSAAKAYVRMRDYATLPKHIAEMTLHQARVAVVQHQWMPAASHLAKLRTLHPPLAPADKPKFDHVAYALAGLAELAGRNYRDAAMLFLRADPQVFTAAPGQPGSAGEMVAGVVWPRAVLTPNDVAVYGGLSALVSMSRAELQARVLDSSTFRSFLELEPHVRRAIAFFVNAKYAQCLSTLEAYRGDWLLDVYLQPLVGEIFAVVRQKCIVQYFEAFSCVSLDEMARQFPPTVLAPSAGTTATTSTETSADNAATADSTPVLEIRSELRALIESGDLPARLDIPNNNLVSPPSNPRREVLLSALEDAEEYERTLRLRLSKINMVAAGLEVKAPNDEARGRVVGDGVGGGLRGGKGTRGGRWG
ncbi:MAG: hypothetical protein Q9165_007052 [Trypethelium subeluteriae]